MVILVYKSGVWPGVGGSCWDWESKLKRHTCWQCVCVWRLDKSNIAWFTNTSVLTDPHHHHHHLGGMSSFQRSRYSLFYFYFIYYWRISCRNRMALAYCFIIGWLHRLLFNVSVTEKTQHGQDISADQWLPCYSQAAAAWQPRVDPQASTCEVDFVAISCVDKEIFLQNAKALKRVTWS